MNRASDEEKEYGKNDTSEASYGSEKMRQGDQTTSSIQLRDGHGVRGRDIVSCYINLLAKLTYRSWEFFGVQLREWKWMKYTEKEKRRGENSELVKGGRGSSRLVTHFVSTRKVGRNRKEITRPISLPQVNIPHQQSLIFYSERAASRCVSGSVNACLQLHAPSLHQRIGSVPLVAGGVDWPASTPPLESFRLNYSEVCKAPVAGAQRGRRSPLMQLV